jgi:hypothetical protein
MTPEACSYRCPLTTVRVARRRRHRTRGGGDSNSGSTGAGHPSLRAMNFSHHTRRNLEEDC